LIKNQFPYICLFSSSSFTIDLDIYKKSVIVMCIESAVAVKLAPARRVEDDPERVVQE